MPLSFFLIPYFILILLFLLFFVLHLYLFFRFSFFNRTGAIAVMLYTLSVLMIMGTSAILLRNVDFSVKVSLFDGIPGPRF